MVGNLWWSATTNVNYVLGVVRDNIKPKVTYNVSFENDSNGLIKLCDIRVAN